jgi:regulator of protease activity HflC (stomatin/prohibitin superfamily)
VTLLLSAAVLALYALWRSRLPLPSGRLLPLLLAALLTALAGFWGTAIIDWARRRAAAQAVRRRWAIRSGDPTLIGQAARWPQAIVVTLTAVAIFAVTFWVPPSWLLTSTPQIDEIYGAAALVLTFPLLILERTLAGMRASRLPEVASLRALLLLTVLTWAAAGAVQIAAGLGAPYTDRLDLLLALPLLAVSAELALRAMGRCFLPPPAPQAARAASESLLARIVAEGVSQRGFAAPVRRHFGIDFSRSWALAFIRAAIPPAAAALVLITWGLTGLVLVDLDQRAVYERFGAPAAVLQPGLHLILPYPMGQVRRTEFGTLHEIALAEVEPLISRSGSHVMTAAEDLPPPDADRLWEQAHPAELGFLIASQSAASQAGADQSFQVVSADIKLRYRIGLTDSAALDATYHVTDAPALLRGAAGQVIGGFFAQRTLDAVLGENREAMAEGLRQALQSHLDALHTGLELTALVIEAIHPPAGAAEAYHAVQAAEIMAVTSIAAERGRAVADKAKAMQYATALTTQARAAGAEIVGAATDDLTRFTADHAAALQNRPAFLLESRLAALAAGLANAPMTVIDHRIPTDDAPTLDFRPPGAASVPSNRPAME